MHRLAVAIAALGLLIPSASLSAADRLEWEVVARRPHDSAAFTQGLVLDGEQLYESTGLRGRSSLREVDPRSGRVLRIEALPDRLFGEGLALVGDELVQLTWQAGLARRYDVETFELLGTHAYEGEGWGLCYDGERLVMSDGSDRLSFRDPHDLRLQGTVAVTLDGSPLDQLNELECVDGEVWANVWFSDSIVRIDPDDGRVSAVVDLAGLIEPHPSEASAGAVLNGIAYDAVSDTFLVTGKRWPELIEIRLHEPDAAARWG